MNASRVLFGPVALILLLLATAGLAQTAGPLHGRVFGSGNRALVVVLHGDVSKGGPADYHYKIAKNIARRNSGVTVLAMLRPGYQDSQGRKSTGSHGGRRDHYTSKNNALVAKTIQAMAKKIGTSKAVGVGHSGGAAQLGVIAGRYPGLMDSVILVSCPCYIKEWRQRRKRSAWKNSQSPHAFLAKIPHSTRLIVAVGTKDTNTFPDMSEKYVATAKGRGISATYVPIRGGKHSFNALQGTVEKLVKTELSK